MENVINRLNDEQKTKVLEFASSLLKKEKNERIYIDGCFDLTHSGHFNAIRQAKACGDELVVGTCSDEEILKTKGPTIFNGRERAEIMRHCKFVDEVQADTPYTPTIEFLNDINCHIK